jgi:hypothetical protein
LFTRLYLKIYFKNLSGLRVKERVKEWGKEAAESVELKKQLKR